MALIDKRKFDVKRKFQPSLDDSGIDVKPFEETNLSKISTLEKCYLEDSPNGKKQPNKGHSDADLGEISLNRKKLKEAETQLRSLKLILEQASSRKRDGIDLTALEKNKTLLEGRVLKLKEYISKKELELDEQDASSLEAKLPEEFSETVQKDKIENDHSLCLNGLENDQASRDQIGQDDKVLRLSFEEASGVNTKVDDWLNGNESSERSESSLEDLGTFVFDENNFIEHLRMENTRLRRELVETRRKKNDERNRVMEQLRMLEKEAVNGERNWMNKVLVKQLRIEELVASSEKLQAKNKELMADLEDEEKLREKELMKSKSGLKKKNEIISELKNKVANVETKKEKLEEDLKKAQRSLDETEATVRNLTERQNELKYELSHKNRTVKEANEELENRSEEIRRMRTDMDNLQSEIGNLREDKKNLNEQLRVLRNDLEKEMRSVEPSLKTELHGFLEKAKLDLENEIKINKKLKIQLSEVRSHVSRFEENETQNKEKMVILEQKLLLRESTIQELTISLGKTIKENDKLQSKLEFGEISSGNEVNVRQFTSHSEKDKSSKSLQEIMDAVKAELVYLQEDFARHMKTVETLGEKWNHYKNSLQEMHQILSKTESENLIQKTRNPSQ